MKRNLFFTLIFTFTTLFSFGGTFQIRATEGDEGYMYIQMRETSGSGVPQTTNRLTDLVFQIKWLTSLGNVDMGSVICTNYEITKSGTRSTQGSYYYQEYYANNTPFFFPENWVQNTWVTIAKMEVGTGSGSGTFEVGDDSFVATGVNIGVDLVDVAPSVNGSASGYSYPTIVYDLVWTGADATYHQYWDYAPNWESTCGGAGAIPNTGDNCLIPITASGKYPTKVYQVSGMGIHQPFCDYLRINSGASLSIDNIDDAASAQILFTVNNNLEVYGTLTIVPDGELTVTGASYFDGAASIVVQADATGVGSFIDNGTITYGGSGTAKVQTYLSNSAGEGNFDLHLIGPTVDEENYTGTGTGAFLEEFIIESVTTYAYEWDETINNTGTEPWVNLTSLTDEIYTGKGIGLSTIDNNNHTLSMTGALMTGAISSPTLTYSNNHIELISNPYPSAIDFDGLAGTDNSSVVENKYWIWNPATNAYVARAAGSGGTQYVQVGQGFFVETKTGGGTFDFTNTRRAHSNDAFRGTVTNSLTVNANGGHEGYKDEIVIRFDDNATSNYDIEIEAKKWESQNNDATQIRSIAEDNTELSINVLPTTSLTSGMTSVPMHFSCGYDTEYLLSFFDIESFDYGTEIWLEDKQIGGDWISINDNPDYTFTATPDDLEDRFVIHFFGPTGVDEFGIENTVEIYSYRQHAFVRNNSNEVIKKINIYTLSGELLQDINSPDLKLNKCWVSDKIGYYVVRVITDKNVYTNKVFISK